MECRARQLRGRPDCPSEDNGIADTLELPSELSAGAGTLGGVVEIGGDSRSLHCAVRPLRLVMMGIGTPLPPPVREGAV